MTCPHCQRVMGDAPHLAGKNASCPFCRRTFVVPFSIADVDQPEPPRPIENSNDPFGVDDAERAGSTYGQRQEIYVHHGGGVSNSGLAAVLSFFFVGLGQIYNGEIGKGVSLMIGWFVGWTCGGFLSLSVVATPLALGGAFVIMPLMIVLYLALWIWNIVDAYQVAERKNGMQRRRRY